MAALPTKMYNFTTYLTAEDNTKAKLYWGAKHLSN